MAVAKFADSNNQQGAVEIGNIRETVWKFATQYFPSRRDPIILDFMFPRFAHVLSRQF